MMYSRINQVSALIAISICGVAQAEIVDSVFWQSSAHNWTGTGMQVQNGKVFGTNDA